MAQQVQGLRRADSPDEFDRLAADEHQRVDFACPELFQRDRFGIALDIDVDAEIIEDNARGHEGAAAVGAEVDTLAGQIVDRAVLDLASTCTSSLYSFAM